MDKTFLKVLLITFIVYGTRGCRSKEIEKVEIPAPDGNLHIYGLPIGQGDSWVIQCPRPSGELTIFDMGSMESSRGLWNSSHIRTFLGKSFHLLKNVIITHNHNDHYNMLPKVITSVNAVKNLSNIYISCTEKDLPDEISDWIKKIRKEKAVKVFNNGRECGPNNISCGFIPLCPKLSTSFSGNNFQNDKKFVEAKVLAANIGQQCASKTEKNRNTDSIVLSLRVGRVKIMMNGDFEDFTSNGIEKNGPQDKLTKFYGRELMSDIYQISHHGASNKANKNIILNATKPRAVMVSSNPFYSHRHPRCSILDRLVKTFKSLCKPKLCKTSGSYCCEITSENVNESSLVSKGFLQKIYTCGGDKSGELRTVLNNQYAIYTTIPSNSTINLINFYTDGSKWGFINKIFPWVK